MCLARVFRVRAGVDEEAGGGDAPGVCDSPRNPIGQFGILKEWIVSRGAGASTRRWRRQPWPLTMEANDSTL